MIDRTHISREDLDLYAMQVLDPQERVPIEAHLRECAECRAALAGARGELAFLTMSVDDATLPPGVRDRFVARIAQTAGSTEPQNISVKPVSVLRRPRLSVWIPWALVAAMLILVAGLETKVQNLTREMGRQAETARTQAEANARARRVLDLLTASDAQHVMLTAAQTHPVPSARAVYLASRGELILQATNLARVPESKTYELWIIPANGEPPVPAGLFRPDASGNASLVLPPLPTGVQAKAFGITVEGASGSKTPTLPIVLSGAAPGE
ncbi:MAG: anti-sigma factor domain-containing protein [Acidobacteriota bacterium]